MIDRTDHMPLVSPNLHGLVFTGSPFALIPEMWPT
jgi:hypothetical protein